MKKLKLLITFMCSLHVFSYAVQADTSYTLTNYAEIATAILRGPLATLSHYNHGKYTKITKALHATTDSVRVTNELLTVINHPNNINPSSYFWIIFDLTNLYIDLFEKDEQSSDDNLMSLSRENRKIIDILAKVSQTCLLPLTESLTTFYRATNIDHTPQGSLLRRQEQAFCSLSRAISIFLNHQHSKPALVLLLGAVTQTILALSNYPKTDVAPEQIIILVDQNQVNNNNLLLENNPQQEDNFTNQEEVVAQEEVDDDDQLVFHDVLDHFEEPDGNNSEQVIINNHDDNNEEDDEEEFVFYDAPDHFEDELLPDGDNPKEQ